MTPWQVGLVLITGLIGWPIGTAQDLLHAEREAR
jgi:hypothetical protein